MNNVAEVLTIAGSVGGGGWWAWSKIFNPLLKKSKAKKAEYWKKLDDIHKEMQMDGNGSIKTAIVELKKTTHRIEGRLDDIESNQKVSMNLQGLAYWISDKDGQLTYVSPMLCKVTGRSESELLGNNWINAIHKSDRERIFRSWEFSVENQTGFDEIYTIQRPDEKTQKVWAVAFPRINQKAFGGTLGKLTPIEEPHKAN